MQYFSTALWYARNENPDADFDDLDIDEQDRLISLWVGEQTLTDLLDPVTPAGERKIVAALPAAVYPCMGGYRAALLHLAYTVVGTLTAHARTHVARLFDEYPATAIAARG